MLIPLIVGCYHVYFVSQRWKDSAFSPFKSSSSSDDDDDDD